MKKYQDQFDGDKEVILLKIVFNRNNNAYYGVVLYKSDIVYQASISHLKNIEGDLTNE